LRRAKRFDKTFNRSYRSFQFVRDIGDKSRRIFPNADMSDIVKDNQGAEISPFSLVSAVPCICKTLTPFR
jgi:hypothetical protein